MGVVFLISSVMQQQNTFVAYAPAQKLSPAEDFMLGGVAAAISKTVAAPIERIKLMVQNQDELLKAGRLSSPYNGVKDYFKRMFNKNKDRDGYAMWFLGNLASGGCAGAASLFFVYSLDYARTRLANDAKSAKGGGERQFNGLIDVYRKTLASDGIAGLYRGFVVSCAGIIVYRGCYFGFFDTLKPMVLTGKSADSFFLSFCLGYAVTVAAGLASYPLDTIRRRMMIHLVKLSNTDLLSMLLKLSYKRKV